MRKNFQIHTQCLAIWGTLSMTHHSGLYEHQDFQEGKCENRITTCTGHLESHFFWSIPLLELVECTSLPEHCESFVVIRQEKKMTSCTTSRKLSSGTITVNKNGSFPDRCCSKVKHLVVLFWYALLSFSSAVCFVLVLPAPLGYTQKLSVLS